MWKKCLSCLYAALYLPDRYFSPRLNKESVCVRVCVKEREGGREKSRERAGEKIRRRIMINEGSIISISILNLEIANAPPTPSPHKNGFPFLKTFVDSCAMGYNDRLHIWRASTAHIDPPNPTASVFTSTLRA